MSRPAPRCTPLVPGTVTEPQRTGAEPAGLQRLRPLPLVPGTV